MKQTNVYGEHGEYKGYMIEDGTNVRAFNSSGKQVSQFNKPANQTYGSNGVRTSFGNTAVTGLFNPLNNK